MKKIGITQRVELVRSHDERRDCLDQRFSTLALQLGCLPIPLFNLAIHHVPHLLDELAIDALILSGGNSLSTLDQQAADAAPERDAFEAALLDEALARDIPVLGVCRGMQMLNVYFGGTVIPCSGHVATRHRVHVDASWQHVIATPVNSYHGYGISSANVASPLRAIAHDDDGLVEAFVHPQKRIMGIMWHPERESPFRTEDLSLIQKALGL